MIKLKFESLPPSINACYRTGRGRMYKSKRLVQYETDIKDYLENVKYEKLTGDIKLTVQFNCKSRRKRDLDNMLKPLIDSLETNELFDNDNQIFEINCSKRIGCESDSTVIYLSELTYNNYVSDL